MICIIRGNKRLNAYSYPENVNSNESLIKLGVSRLHELIVDMLGVIECVEALANELEQSLEIFRRR